MKCEKKEFLSEEKIPNQNLDSFNNKKSSEILSNNVYSVSSNQMYINYLILKSKKNFI